MHILNDCFHDSCLLSILYIVQFSKKILILVYMTHYIRRRPGKISERIKLIGQTKNFFQDLKPWMSTNRSPLDAVLIS